VHTAHGFAERRVLDVGETRASRRGRQEQVPESRRTRLLTKFVEQRDVRPALAAELLVVAHLVRIDVLVHERTQPREQRQRLWRMIEIHAAQPG
jgi:hypothetical protein